MVLSAAGFVSALESLTAKAQSTQNPANQITIVNIALAVSGSGPIPVVTTRLQDMVVTGGTTIQSAAGTKSYTNKDEQTSIASAWRDLSSVYQDLLNTLIGKGGLVPQLLPFVGPPVASVLRQLESVIDTIAFELIDLNQAQSTELTKQKDALDAVIIKTIDVWSGTVPI